jgi:WD40 repeat protein
MDSKKLSEKPSKQAAQPSHSSSKKEDSALKPIEFSAKSKKVLSVAWNSDGSHLASFSTDNLVKIWNYEDLELTRAFDCKGHGDKVAQVAWHPTDPNTLASVSYDSSLKIWDTRMPTSKSSNSISSRLSQKTSNRNVNL